MPCSAVSAACASSAGRSTSPAKSSVPDLSAEAIDLSVRIFAADRPARFRRGARTRKKAAASSGSSIAVSRPQIAAALAVESCWETTIEASPAKPPSRRRSGDRQNARKTRIELEQRLRRGVQIGLGMNEERHGAGAVSHARFPLSQSKSDVSDLDQSYDGQTREHPGLAGRGWHAPSVSEGACRVRGVFDTECD